MKPGYIIIAIIVSICSLLASIQMDFPYPFFIVVAIEVLIYKVYTRAARKKRERNQQEMFQMHMRNRNTR
jgi:membrane protein implicated in regulation of membrane protease activity